MVDILKFDTLFPFLFIVLMNMIINRFQLIVPVLVFRLRISTKVNKFVLLVLIQFTLIRHQVIKVLKIH